MSTEHIDEIIDGIIAKNITITDPNLYEGVFNAVSEAMDQEKEWIAAWIESWCEGMTAKEIAEYVRNDGNPNMSLVKYVTREEQI